MLGFGCQNMKSGCMFITFNHFQNGLARMELGSAFSPTFVYINLQGEVVLQED
jgi:hypothetical protein